MTQQQSQQQQLPCSLQHFRHTLPGLTEGTGTRQKIQRWPFLDLLEHDLPVIIPLFQRKYCWEKAQGDKWWTDLLAIKPEFCKRGYGHVVGKVIFKVREDEGLICIDGQQRTTTSSLLASAIKEGFLRKKRELLASSPPATSDDVKLQQQQQQQQLAELTARLDKYMFLKPEEARQWALETWGDWKEKKQKQQQQTETKTSVDLDEYITDGELLRFARLHPSHIDRQPYFQSIMSSMLLDTAAEEAGVDLARDCPGGIRLGSVTVDAMQGKMKTLFDEKVSDYFSNTSLEAFAVTHEQQGDSILSIFLSATELLLKQAFMGMSIIYVEVLHDVNLAQVFHYMQELHLFGFSALMFNPSPGLDFRASDLARNLLLAPTMNWRMKQQETAHMTHWVGPIEGCYRKPGDIDRVLKLYLDEEEAREKERELGLLEQQQQNQSTEESEVQNQKDDAASESNDSFFKEIVGDVGGSRSTTTTTGSSQHQKQQQKKSSPTRAPGEEDRYISDFEKTVLKSINAFKKKKQVDGMLLYARFYSHYEKQLLERWNNRHSSVVGGSLESNVDDGELSESEQVEWCLDKEILGRVGAAASRMKKAEQTTAESPQSSSP